MVVKNIAIFASGNGSNAENIIRYFDEHPGCGHIAVVMCNNPKAGVIERARRLSTPTHIISRAELADSSLMLGTLSRYDIDLIVLAGFLLMIPGYLLEAYKGRIVNIHPSLLPKYGGKGMYGRHIHEAVVKAGEKETGITIHLVDEVYDSGEIIFQATVDVLPGDTADDVEAKIHRLEKQHYPRVIAMMCDTVD